jgi:hypothetical protein
VLPSPIRLSPRSFVRAGSFITTPRP